LITGDEPPIALPVNEKRIMGGVGREVRDLQLPD
tara:strand:- start:216 stop:317 length:102 start_codon:yes stop_codon:yes gene_type:complete